MLTMLTALTLSAAPSGLALLLVERGGNFEPQGNERFIVKAGGGVLYERGRGVSTKQGTTFICERFTWTLTAAQLAAFDEVVAAARLPTLEPSYVDPDVHDGQQAGLVARVAGKVVASTFSNRFPPQYESLAVGLRRLVDELPTGLKAQRCDTASWLFLRPPAA